MKHQDLRRALCGAFLALALGGSARAALVTVSSTETWNGVANPHAGDGVTLSGSGTETSPRTYTIPNGLRITSAGRIILHGSGDYSIKFVLRGGDLQMDAGAVLNLERYKIRTGRQVLVLDLSGTNSITGAGRIGPITHRDSNPRVLTITNVQNVSLAEIDLHTENVNLDTNPRRHLNITANGTLVVTGNIDNSDDDTSGDGGADVNIKAGAITVHNVETRTMRDDGSARAANYNVLLQALSPLGNYNPNDSVNNSFTNKLTVTGGINTLGRTNLGGNVTLQSVVLQLIETGRIIKPAVGTKTVQVGVVRGGASANDLYLDSYGTAKTPTSVVQWGDTAVIPPPPSGPTLVIDDINFHDATNSPLVSEGQVHSAGGTMFVAIRNTGLTRELITKLTINGTALADLANLKWWRQQPSGYVAPGQLVSILAHVAGSPVTENASVTVAAECLSGQTAGAVTRTLTTPKLRIGSVVPSADYRTLYLFLRNLDAVAWTVNDVFVNSNVTAQCTFVGGSTTISPSQVGIIKVAYGMPLAYLTPLSLRVNATPSGGSTTTVGASIRLMDSEFNLGSWDSRAWSSKTNCSNLRDRYQHTVQIGAEDYEGTGITNGLPYYLRAAVPLYPSQKASVGYLKKISQLASVYSWYNHDEPDINNITSTTLNWNTVTFFDVSARPVMTTLVSTKMFNEMGWTVDMPTMDHYAHNAPLVNSTPTTHLLQEVLWYSDKLKENTEPLRAWNWCQGVAPGTWGTQPFAWSIESQFWTHIMCGAKGIKWFKAAATNDVANPNEFNRIESCVRRFEQVKNIALFGESIGCTSSSNVKAPTRGIVGEDAMIAVVASHNDSKAFLGPYSLGALTVTLTVNVPPWIPIEQVTQVGAGNDPNPTTPTYTVSGQTVTITGITLDSTTTNGSAKVFLIGRNDTTPPDAPTGLIKARDLSSTAIELSWEGARDNYGVKGYLVYRNGVQIGDTYGLVYTDTGYSAGAIYSVRAFDIVTNLSAAAFSAPPVTPTGLTALVTNSLVRLTWSAAVGATGYNVKRSAASGGPYSVVGTTAVATYDDAAVTVGLTYYYVVTATNSAGQRGVSAAVGVNVVAVPEVTVPPVSRTNNAGTIATFTVTAPGGFLSYQWRKGTQDLVNGGNISGATTPTLTLTAVSQTDAGNYSVVVSNAAGTATSAVASLTVIDPPPPMLWFEAAPAGQVSLYWSGTGFVLQQNADVSDPGSWLNAPTGTNMPAVVPIGGSNLFYRLKWPE